MKFGFQSVYLPSNEVARCFSCNACVRGPSGPWPDRDPDFEQRCVSEMKPGLRELFFYKTSPIHAFFGNASRFDLQSCDHFLLTHAFACPCHFVTV